VQAGERLGLICEPSGTSWNVTHCQNPFIQNLPNGRSRIHIAGRDAKNRSCGVWAEFEMDENNLKMVRRCSKPSLDLGELGAFDDSGAMPSSIVSFNGRLLMFYTGWTRGGTVPFHFHIGLVESDDGGETFRRVSRAPVLGRNRHDPFIVGAPWVLAEGGSLRMWYSSAIAWRLLPDRENSPVHFYTIKHATSSNGVDWETTDAVCLDFLENEYAIARPVVTYENNLYRMVYSARRLNSRYEIFQAYSCDGLTWRRIPEPLLQIGADSWETEMVCYGCEARVGATSYFLYNGNDYGRAGFGAIRLTKHIENSCV